MCGLVGFYNPDGFVDLDATEIAEKMSGELVHRGPDDSGKWFDYQAGIAFAHRRLSILDLSQGGHQPMLSSSGRYVLVFNGEIYNHQEIRLKVEAKGAFGWRGNSDTESLLAAIELWGLEQALVDSVGMFALALWDRKERSLSLARDRMGEKPLYYGWQGSSFLFGSELKALRSHPEFQSVLDREALPLYLQHGYIPGPWSIWKGIRKLTQGTFLRIKSTDFGVLPEPIPYWSLDQVVEDGARTPFVGSADDAIAELETVLRQSVTQQMVADVPLGAFLSGGIDSSMVVALMAAESGKPVKSFCIGFSEEGFNEVEHAKAVAQHLGTDHTELYVSAEQSREVIPLLPIMFDEPFADSSAIPTHLVSKLARQQVTVSLSGDGGDELFAGYPHYAACAGIWNGISVLPNSLRKMIGGAIQWLLPEIGMPSPGSLDTLRKVVSRYNRFRSLGRQMQSTGIADFFYYRRAVWNNLNVLASGNDYPDEGSVSNSSGAAAQMMQLEASRYLPDDIMVKVDRASMAVSLESRAPLLDHRVVEMAWKLPMQYKLGNNRGKWILRELLYRYVPRELVDRPKAGFSVPVNEWLRGPLRDWAEELLNESTLKQQGYFNTSVVHRKWQQFVQGRIDYGYQFWVLLMFQGWMHENSCN